MSDSLSPIGSFLSISRNESADVARAAAADPTTQRLVAHFQASAPTLTSPDALLKDRQSLQVVLGAFGLGSQINNTAVLRALMTQNPSDPTSLAQRSGNAGFLRFARQLSNWAAPGPLSSAASVASITQAYQTSTFETNQGQQTPGMQEALYFNRTANSITSIPALMADTSQLKVALAGIGIPFATFGALDYDTQVRTLTAKINLKDFQDPSKVQRMSEQYLAQQQTDSSASLTPDAGSVASLFGTSDPTSGLFSILGNAMSVLA